MAYCTYTELANITGSDLGQTILEAIIAQGDREIDAYLNQYGVTGSATGAVKAASLKFGQAGVYELSGEGSTGTAGSALPWSVRMREEAYELLKRYVSLSTTASSSTTTRVRSVQGI
jgi:hypothetical protein